MHKFWKDSHGAVVVMVTLLLVPALLISGTCVDIARSYAARSVLQNGNLMGANAWLTQYNALLQDVYGLFGVYDEEDELSSGKALLRDYIEASIFGPEERGGLGMFDLLYDSELTEAQLEVTKHLGDPAVLRNQIEEYSKYRAPITIAEELLDKLEVFEKMKGDASAIRDKIEIDQEVGDIKKTYQELYKKIYQIENDADGYPPNEQEAFDEINSILTEIREKMEQMKRLQEQIAALSGVEDDPEAAEQLAGLEKELNTCGKELTQLIEKLKETAEYYADLLEKYKKKLDALVSTAIKAEKQKKELAEQLEKLETKLTSGECSAELSSGMSTSLEEYRKLLEKRIPPMAEKMQQIDAPHIDTVVQMLRNISIDGTSDGTGNGDSVALDDFSNLSSKTSGLLQTLNTGLTDGSFSMNRPEGFKRFRECSDENAEFYEILEKMFSKTGDEEKGEKTKSVFLKLLKNVKEKIVAGFGTETAGASHYPGTLNGSSADSREVELETGADWGEDNKAQDAMRKLLDSDILDEFGEIVGAIGDKALLVVYDTEMFSNYTSPNKAGEYDLTMSNIPMNTQVNYFFQSELEYLYHGDKDSAPENLTAVTNLLLLVRVIFNYIAAFTIPEINNIVVSIETLLAFLGPFAFGIGELARFGLTVGESYLDVIKLRSGDSVPIFKTSNSWVLGGTKGIRDFMESADDAIAVLDSVTEDAKKNKDKQAEHKIGEMTYRDYVRLFLLLRSGNTLASRTANLIALNITNYKTGNQAKENAMDLMSLDRFGTSIQISSTLELRYLFLSMGYAQKGIDGVVPPKSITIKSVEYRGY